MLNVGPAEVLVIALIALIVVGPEQLPGVLRKIGKGAGQLRHMADGLKKDFMEGMDELDPNKWVEDKPRGSGTINDPIISPGTYAAESEDGTEPESDSEEGADPFAGKSTRRLAEEKAAKDDAAARAAQSVTKPAERSSADVEPASNQGSDSSDVDEGDKP